MDSDDEQEIRSYLTNLTTISNSNSNDIANIKLNIIPTDLLDEQEIKIIDDFEKYTNTTVAVSFEKDQIIIILSIPQFSKSSFEQIILEPMPNNINKSIFVRENEILIDNKQNAYYKTGN